ncbi:Hypothetical protein, putative [Bodo saltans]|uniref:Uncharacterized protein n=1 Tax=Bodo saltans TaxID=75058 RepID=A0A0S4JWN6_BODSA|nr:Hypothetical protein, putative [Bodo saltans]|eukprot:CUG94455.1 Hypothetical protein, putative [Bodo saltans]
MIGTVEPQEDASQTAEDNLVIETPLHYEEVTRPSVSQEVDRVVTAVLTPMVPGVYLVCFAKGLAWDNTSKLASGQQRSPEGLALSAAVRRTLETSSSWIRQFDHDDQAQSAAEQQTSPSSSSPWTALGALHQSVGITPVLGVNRTASVRLPTLSDVNVWTILRVRTPTIIDTKRLIQLHMNGPRVVMTLSSAAVKRVASRSSVIVGWATACVESEYSTSIHKNDVGHRVREGLVDSEEFDESMKDSLGHRPGVALARTISTLTDNSVTISFLLSAKNLCGKRSVQLLAGWRRVARAVRTPHRNRFVAHNPQHALDDSDVDAHRVVWRTIAVAVELPDQILDVMYRDSANSGSATASALLDATSRNEYMHASVGRGDPQSDDPPPVGLDASPVALDLDDGLDDL